MTDEKALLEDLRRKYSGRDIANFAEWDFRAAFGSPLDAAMYLGLFWPKFVRFEGMVFMPETLEDETDRQRVLSTLQRYHGDRTMTEKAFNFLEYPSSFSGRVAESSDTVDEFVVRSLVDLWTCRLHSLFPGEVFIVEYCPEDSATGEEVGLIFYGARPQP